MTLAFDALDAPASPLARLDPRWKLAALLPAIFAAAALRSGTIILVAVLATGLLLALGLIGWGRRVPLGARLREVSRDVVTLSFGFALLLVWAGFVEAFLSQYHEPVIPYVVKIAFGCVELVLLCLFLAKSGTHKTPGA